MTSKHTNTLNEASITKKNLASGKLQNGKLLKSWDEPKEEEKSVGLHTHMSCWEEAVEKGDTQSTSGKWRSISIILGRTFGCRPGYIGPKKTTQNKSILQWKKVLKGGEKNPDRV